MQTVYALVFAIIPIFLEGCCVLKSHKERTDLKSTTMYHYTAVEGEIFMMQCVNSLDQHSSEVVWSRCGEGRAKNEHPAICTRRQKGNEIGVVSRDNVLKFPAVEAKHSGNYSCLIGGRELFFHLHVLEKASLGCTEPEESSVTLRLGAGGEIPCPGFSCSDQTSNTDVIWYKGGRAVSELQKKRDICEEKSHLLLCTVYEIDTGVYFCDRHTSEQGVVWTNRRAVNVTVIPQNTRDPPLIILPHGNKTEEVELGQSHILTCKVKFGFQRKVFPLIQWYTNNHGKKEDVILIHMESQQEKWSTTEFLVTQKAVIQEVTLLHFNYTYTCFASNAVGNSSATIKLKRKTGVKWLAVVVYPIVPLLLVTGLGIILRVKWLELSLIYRSHYRHANNGEDEKDFDVFLSYMWSPLSGEQVGGLPLFPPSGSDIDENASSSGMDQLKTEEGYATQRPLEVLLPQVLENQWSYRLCLLERDLLPGAAYTDEVVHALQRSRMLICLLSADYLSNSNTVFVLESGIQALLQDSHLKLLLIWTRGTPVLLGQLDPPLPSLVRRALKVLPTLNWETNSQLARTTNTFWRSLRKAMPVQSKAGFPHAESE